MPPAIIAKWQSDLDKWWFDARTVLMRHKDDIVTPVNQNANDIAELQEQVATLQDQITTLQTQITVIQNSYNLLRVFVLSGVLYNDDDGKYYYHRAKTLDEEGNPLEAPHAIIGLSPATITPPITLVL